ncbi:MAG: lipoprotein [Pseudomonadota bacterium]
MSIKLKLCAIIVAGAALAGCGVRGPLERPDPLFGERPADAPTARLPSQEEIDTLSETPRRNTIGGEIPETAPVDPVDEAPLEEPAQGAG